MTLQPYSQLFRNLTLVLSHLFNPPETNILTTRKIALQLPFVESQFQKVLQEEHRIEIVTLSRTDAVFQMRYDRVKFFHVAQSL
jgi:hypothetical protein